MESEQASRVADSAGLLTSPTRRAIVDALRSHRPAAGDLDAGGMTAAQLAELLGLHHTTVRFHTDRLEAAGIIGSHLTTAFGVGRPRKVYAVRPTAAGTGRTAYLLRLLQLMTESFSAGATPEQAGEQWARRHLDPVPQPPATSPGAWLSKVGPLVDVLQDWGYAPQLATAESGRTCHLTLNACPFLELARAHPDVVCGIHEGLLRGALRQVGEDDVDISLTPFVGPNLCHAQVTTRQPFVRHHEEPPDESRQPDAEGPDLGSPVLHQDGGQ